MDTFAQQIARVQELLNTHPEIGMAVGGFGLGVVVASLFALFSRQKLLARALAAEARVEAQHEALEQAGEVLDERFRAAAQDALLKSNEQFLQLARERLGAQQQTSSQDLEKRQKAIAELLNPVNEHLKALSGAIAPWLAITLGVLADPAKADMATCIIVGSPETVARKIVRTVTGLGVQRFDLKYTTGPVPHAANMACLKLYGERVIPMVRDILAG